MSRQTDFRRGDVVVITYPFVSDPSQAKRRPAVVLQNDTGNRFSPNLIVAAITSTLPHRKYRTDHWVAGDSAAAREAGLDRDAVVKTDVIYSVPKTAVLRRLGHFPDDAMQGVDQCLKVSLGLN